MQATDDSQSGLLPSCNKGGEALDMCSFSDIPYLPLKDPSNDLQSCLNHSLNEVVFESLVNVIVN